jgi:hypothetical protein
LGVLYRGIGISKIAIFDKKKYQFFLALHFFQSLVIKTLDPELDLDPPLEKNAGSGSALNQCNPDFK